MREQARVDDFKCINIRIISPVYRLLQNAWRAWLFRAARQEDLRLRLMGSIKILQQTKLNAAWVSWKDATHAKALARAKAVQAMHLMQNVYIFRGLKASQSLMPV